MALIHPVIYAKSLSIISENQNFFVLSPKMSFPSSDDIIFPVDILHPEPNSPTIVPPAQKSFS